MTLRWVCVFLCYQLTLTKCPCELLSLLCLYLFQSIKFFISIFSKSTVPIKTKLERNVHWIFLFFFFIPIVNPQQKQEAPRCNMRPNLWCPKFCIDCNEVKYNFLRTSNGIDKYSGSPLHKCCNGKSKNSILKNKESKCVTYPFENEIKSYTNINNIQGGQQGLHQTGIEWVGVATKLNILFKVGDAGSCETLDF